MSPGSQKKRFLLSVVVDRTTNNSKEEDTVAVMSLLKAGMLDFCSCLEYINMVSDQIHFVTSKKTFLFLDYRNAFWTLQIYLVELFFISLGSLGLLPRKPATI